MQQELIEYIPEDWNIHSGIYSDKVKSDIQTFKKEAYKNIFAEYNQTGKKLRALDVGTGPGFFAILLAELGFTVTAVDISDGMLAQAQQNAKDNGQNGIKFLKMNAEKLDFPDKSFDLVVSRNITWDLPNPEQAYTDWLRVLDDGGKIMNFDQNCLLYLYDEVEKAKHEEDIKIVLEKGLVNMWDTTNYNLKYSYETMSTCLPLSKKYRPTWDADFFAKQNIKKVIIEYNLNDRILDELEQANYRSKPMFLVCAEKY